MLKDWITTCTKISVGRVAIIDTLSYLIRSQITVPDEEEAPELHLEQKLLLKRMWQKVVHKNAENSGNF